MSARAGRPFRVRSCPPVHSPLSPRAFVRALRHDGAAIALAGVLRRELHADDALACGSGTQALQLALTDAARVAASREPGRPPVVALPAFCCFDVASAAVGAGVPVVLYDVDPRTLGPDLESLERVLAEGARVVVVASLFGVPPDWDAIDALARSHGALLVEDAAQGHGASWRGRALGTLGAWSVLSFGRGKGWTGGRGGALLRRGAAADAAYFLAPAADRRASLLASSAAQWLLARPAFYGIPQSLPFLSLGETVYKAPVAPGAMSDSAAAMALATRAAARVEAGARVARASRLLDRLSALSDVELPVVSPHAEPGWLRLPLLVDGADALADELTAFGVARSYPTTLAELAPLAPLLRDAGRAFTGAATLVRRLVTLPTHSLVSRAMESRLLDALERRLTHAGGGAPSATGAPRSAAGAQPSDPSTPRVASLRPR